MILLGQFPLAADDGSGRVITQLIFVALMVGAWVLRKAAEAKKRHDARRPQPRVPTPDMAMPPSVGVPPPVEDVVYGTRALEHPPHASGPWGQESPVRSAPLPDSAVGAQFQRNITPTAGSSQPGVTDRVERRRTALVRLGIDSGADLRTRTRMAIRFSEVLGPPRALRGPHRSPASERARRARPT